MATTITPVTENHIRHCMLIDLTLEGTTYYLSGAYKPLTYNSNTYTELGSFIGVSEMPEDIKTTNGDISISLSGIPSEQNYMNLILTTKIKGGEVIIRRAFFNEDYSLDSANVFQRYRGVITNFAVSEDTAILEGKNTNTVTVSCASINTVLDQKVAGQRSNPTDREKFFPGDGTFDRVPDLHRVSFDFGKEYSGGSGGYGGGGGGGGRRGGGGSRNQLRR
jgi:uncharacterized membrane protein YgcG